MTQGCVIEVVDQSIMTRSVKGGFLGHCSPAPVLLKPRYVLKSHFSVMFSIPFCAIMTVPIAFACCRRGQGPPWEPGGRRNQGRAVRLDHDEELAGLGKPGLERRRRRVE